MPEIYLCFSLLLWLDFMLDVIFFFLQDTMDMNQDLLRFLGVSHPSLEEVCKLCLSHGLHAKLTGAGGGGCAFCLITPGNFLALNQSFEYMCIRSLYFFCKMLSNIIIDLGMSMEYVTFSIWKFLTSQYFLNT